MDEDIEKKKSKATSSRTFKKKYHYCIRYICDNIKNSSTIKVSS